MKYDPLRKEADQIYDDIQRENSTFKYMPQYFMYSLCLNFFVLYILIKVFIDVNKNAGG